MENAAATKERDRIVAALRNWAKIADAPEFAVFKSDADGARIAASMIEAGAGSFAWPDDGKDENEAMPYCEYGYVRCGKCRARLATYEWCDDCRPVEE
jgi:hypothetical protein